MTSLLIPTLGSDVAAAVEAGLGRVESRFREQLETSLRPVAELCEHVERYRGKMLRPTLVILCGLASNSDLAEATEGQIAVAATIEMIHLATLVHDDVLDEAAVRRGGDTVNKRKGNESAIILGDYLLSKAFHLCSTLDSQRTALRIGEVTSVVCEGEMLQLAHRGDFGLDAATYFDIIRRKTAALIALACELGVVHAGGTRLVASRLAEFGERIGTAFQIQDDLLDLVGDEPVVGKSLGRDLEKGTLTLPLIHHLARAEAAVRDATVRLLKSGAERGVLAAALGASGSIAHSKQAAEGLVARARTLLDPIPDSPAKAALWALAEAAITRTF
jgi:octaprenyl-diphosphate synthase